MDRKDAKEITRIWRRRYNCEIEKVLEDPTSQKDDLIEVVFKWTLDTFSPIEEDKQQALKLLDKQTYSGTRNDADLYLRIMYAADSAINAIKRNYSDINQFAIWAHKAWVQALIKGRQDFFAQGLQDPKAGVKALRNRAAQELQNKGHEVPCPFIKLGSHGKYHGVAVTLDEFVAYSGLIPVKYRERKDLARFDELVPFGNIAPIELYSGNFVAENRSFSFH